MKVFCGIVPLDLNSPSGEVVAAYESLAPAYSTRRAGPLLLVSEPSTPADHSAAGRLRVFGDLEIHAIAGREIGPEESADRLAECFVSTGPGILPYVRGEFAMAVVDENEGSILLARDQIGTRGLYWSVIGGDLVFASVPSLVARHPGYRFEPDRWSIAVGILKGDGELVRTPWESISRVPSGSWIRWRGSDRESKRYWRPAARSVRMTASEAVEGYREAFFRAIRRRYRSGKTGAFLSGGLDSSAVVCAAAEQGLDLPTYTLRFPEDPLADEGHFVDMVLRKYGLRNTAIEIVAPGSVPKWRRENNTGSPEVFYYPNLQMLEPLYEAAASAGTGRLIDGLAGDHLLHSRATPLDLIGSAIASARWSEAARIWAQWPAIDGSGRARGIARALLRRGAPPLLRFLWGKMKSQFPARFVSRSLAMRPATIRALYPWKRPALLNQARAATAESMTSRWNLERWLEQNYLLAHSHGIEQSSPYTDVDLVEFVLSVPIEHLFDPSTTRWLQREAMRGILPEEIRLRTGKGEFDGVIMRVLHDDLLERVIALFRQNGIDAASLLADPETVERWRDRIEAGTADWETPMFLETLNHERWLAEARSGSLYSVGEGNVQRCGRIGTGDD